MRRTLAHALVPILLGLLALPAPGEEYASDVADAVNSIVDREVLDEVRLLSSDRMKGRLAGSLEGYLAAQYLAARFRAAGLEPRGVDGTYFQPFALNGQYTSTSTELSLEECNFVRIYVQPTDAEPAAVVSLSARFGPAERSPEGFTEGPVLYAGYGSPAHASRLYRRNAARGAVVLMLDEGLADDGQDPAARRDAQVAAAAAAQARAVLLIRARGESTPPASGEEAPPPVDSYPIPVAWISEEAAVELLAAGGVKLDPFLEKTRKGASPKPQPLNVLLQVLISRSPVSLGPQGRNVLAVWPGTDPDLADEMIVISAHYDHVGLGQFGSRRGKGEVHNGADDNASGTAGLVAIAQALGSAGVKLRRSVLIIAFDAEEGGILGSEAFVGSPTVPLDEIIADLNMDMISKNHPTKIYVGGRESSPELDAILLKIASRFRLNLLDRGMEQYINRSDQASFIKHSIPAIFLFGGTHAEYHTPDDDWNTKETKPKKLETITKLQLLVAVELSERDERPVFTPLDKK